MNSRNVITRTAAVMLGAGILIACAGPAAVYASEQTSQEAVVYDFTAEDPKALQEIDLKSLSKKKLRKAYRELLATYTKLYNEYYEIEEEDTQPEEQAPEPQNVYHATANLNIRSAPTTESEIKGRFAAGETVNVQSIEDGWALITYNEETAYVSAQYIAEGLAEGASGEAAQPDDGQRGLPESARSFIGAYYQDVVDELLHAGFTNVSAQEGDTADLAEEELPFGSFTETGDVIRVSVGEKDDFEKGDRYPVDTVITVEYYGVGVKRS